MKKMTFQEGHEAAKADFTAGRRPAITESDPYVRNGWAHGYVRGWRRAQLEAASARSRATGPRA